MKRSLGTRRVARIAAVAVAASLALAAGASATAESAHAGTNHVTWKSGVFDGYGTAGDVSFAAWRNAPIATGTDYLPGGTWAGLDNPTWTISQWSALPGVQPTLGVPLFVDGGNLADAASGQYNTYFATLAKNLVAGGLGKSVLRLGWEPDGTWYRWSVSNPTEAAQYAAAWRQIVTAMRAVPGANFTYDWNLSGQATSWDPALAYPGDAYVSEIGEDVYDWNAVAGQGPNVRWNNLVNKQYGLAWQASFAAAHHKPVSFPEWGLVYSSLKPMMGGGDDPTFVSNMYTWFATHNTAFENYFDSDGGGVDYGITTGNPYFPKATAMYRLLFGSA